MKKSKRIKYQDTGLRDKLKATKKDEKKKSKPNIDREED
jgi:hypothetical protein